MRHRTKAYDPGLTEALDRVRTKTRLVELLCEAGADITLQAVCKWRRVPGTRCLDVERVTGVPRYRLRPDIYGEDPKARGKRPKSQESLRFA
jgi:DNA-binding transcriptional regulator YdaS (Cro superfamily)